MNTQIINAELLLALRKCLPFVKRHAIISGGDGSLTYSFAVRALADADARQREQEAVKNIAEAERKRQIDAACTFTVTKAMARANEAREAEVSYWRNRYPPPARTVREIARAHGYEGKLPLSYIPTTTSAEPPFPWSAWRRSMRRSGFTEEQIARAQRRIEGSRAAGERSLKALARDKAHDLAKRCDCDICRAIRRTSNFYKD